MNRSSARAWLWLRVKGLLLETVLLLVLAQVALRLVPMRVLQRMLQRQPRGPEAGGEHREALIQGVCWAIETVAPNVPGAVCFPRALAAWVMLRRRGTRLDLYYGAEQEPSGRLTGHVWLQDGARGVLGHQELAARRPLACLSKPQTSESGANKTGE